MYVWKTICARGYHPNAIMATDAVGYPISEYNILLIVLGHQNIRFIILYTHLTFATLEHFIFHRSLITNSSTLTTFKSTDKIVAWYFLFDCGSRNSPPNRGPKTKYKNTLI